MWLSFFAGGCCAVAALSNFLNKSYIIGTCMTLLSVLNIILGVINL
jgi:hypothetical protein